MYIRNYSKIVFELNLRLFVSLGHHGDAVSELVGYTKVREVMEFLSETCHRKPIMLL